MNRLTLAGRTLAGVGVGLVLVALPVVVMADSPATGPYYAPNTTGNSGFPNSQGSNSLPNTTGNSPTNCGSGNCSVANPLGSTTSLCGLLQKLFQGVVAIAIPIAVLFIIWSGFQFVLAQGQPKKLQKARQNFLYTIVGIGIFLGAWLIATVIAATVNAVGGSNIISCQ